MGGHGAGSGLGGGGAGGGAGSSNVGYKPDGNVAPGFFVKPTPIVDVLAGRNISDIMQAADHLYSQFGSKYAVYKFYEQNIFDWNKWNSLTSDEQQAIIDYTDHYYHEINGIARSEGNWRFPGYNAQNALDNIPSAMEPFTLTQDLVTWRGDSGAMGSLARMAGATEAEIRQLAASGGLRGINITDEGYMSSGVTEYDAWGGITYQIYAPAGTRGMYVDLISANQGEREFLYNRGTTLQILDYKTDSYGDVTEVTAIVVQQGGTTTVAQRPKKP